MKNEKANASAKVANSPHVILVFAISLALRFSKIAIHSSGGNDMHLEALLSNLRFGLYRADTLISAIIRPEGS